MVKIAIVGSGIAGVSAAKAAKKQAPAAEVTLFSSESVVPYYRPDLTEVIADPAASMEASFFINPPEWYGENGISLKLSTTVVKVDAAEHRLYDDKGNVYCFDRLIFATGALPFVPAGLAENADDVFVLRSCKDALGIAKSAKKSNDITIIGGGLIGLEAAWHLSLKGKKVKVVELADRLLPKQLDTDSSNILRSVVEAKGVEIITGKSAEKIMRKGNGKIVLFADGSKTESDLVILSLGVRADAALAEECGAAVDRGILVNERCETSLKDIYACGDAAQIDSVPNLWGPGMRSGTAAGTNAAGGEARFLPDLYPVIFNAFDINLIAAGSFSDEDKAIAVKNGSVVKKLFFRDGKCCGGVLFNAPVSSVKMLSAVRSSLPEEKVPADLGF